MKKFLRVGLSIFMVYLFLQFINRSEDNAKARFKLQYGSSTTNNIIYENQKKGSKILKILKFVLGRRIPISFSSSSKEANLDLYVYSNYFRRTVPNIRPAGFFCWSKDIGCNSFFQHDLLFMILMCSSSVILFVGLEQLQNDIV